MTTLVPSPFLRQALIADAATSAACGLLMLLAAGPLAGLLGLPEPLLRIAGAVLIPFALFVGFVGMRDQISRMSVYAVIGINVLWVMDSVLLLVSGYVTPTTAGYVFVLAQAAAVLMYAEFQIIGIRRSQPMPA